MKNLKIFFLIIGLVFLGIGIHFLYSPFLKNALVPVTLADGEEDEDDEEDNQPKKTNSKNSSDSGSKVTYKTVYIQLPDTIRQITKQIPRHDSDGDGLYDDEDPHPTINEFLIVQDNNLNGIDDRYEKL